MRTRLRHRVAMRSILAMCSVIGIGLLGIVYLFKPAYRTSGRDDPEVPTQRQREAITALQVLGVDIIVLDHGAGITVSVTDQWPREEHRFDVRRLIAELPPIESLSLIRLRISRDNLLQLGALDDVRELDISGSVCEDDVVPELLCLNQVRHFAARKCMLSDAHMEYMWRMPRVEDVDLTESAVNGGRWPDFSEWVSVKALRLAGVTLDLEAVQSLCKCPTLRMLDLGGCTLGSSHMKALGCATQLEHMDLRGAYVAAEDVAEWRARNPNATVLQ